MVGNTTTASTGKINTDIKCRYSILPGCTFAPGETINAAIGEEP